MVGGERDGGGCCPEEEMDLQPCTTEHYSDSEDECGEEEAERDVGVVGELKQHLLAVLVAVVAAVAFHANLQGGFGAWREELARDWRAVKNRWEAAKDIHADSGVGEAPYAAPSMDAIPASQRRRALERALGMTDTRGHARARSYKRTGGLSFCPTNADAPPVPETSIDKLVELEFILPLKPSVRVLHSYYLADALGVDSSMVYEDVNYLGSYESDKIMNEVDELLTANEGEGLMLDKIESIVRSHLPSIPVYKEPHVSTFYRSRHDTAEKEPNYGMPPASLTFTGYAMKFVNLSPQPLNLYWDGGRIASGSRAGEMHTVLVGTVPAFESIGTASFPGHSFYLAPTYDKKHQLKRWAVTEDEPILYYDPLEDLPSKEQREQLTKLTAKQRFARDAWAVDRTFGRDYLIKTGRVWLANFPQPYVSANEELGLHMWQAEYIGQTHTTETSNLYFTSLPQSLERLTRDDYLPEAEKRRRLEMKPFQSSSLKQKGANSDDATMQLSLKVRSVAPRVLEVKKFLSPTEVQHLIDLASGTKGDVQMKRSTVSASNANVEARATKADARSSTGGWIHREQDAIVDTIFRRVADLLNIDENLMRDQPRDYSEAEEGEEPLHTHDRLVEAMQLLRYGPGEEYSAHHDFAYPSIENRYQPKRYATVLLYLTGEGDVVENGVRRAAANGGNGLKGGETTFPRAVTADFHDGVKINPQSGKAVVFYNVLSDGNMDDLSQHAGEKVEKGVKYAANDGSTSSSSKLRQGLRWAWALLQAVAYELQPFRIRPCLIRARVFICEEEGLQRLAASLLERSTSVLSTLQKLLQYLLEQLKQTDVKSIKAAFASNKSLLAKGSLVLFALRLYFHALRYLHELLHAGPLVIIVTLLILLYTIGLGDNTGAASGIPSAYSVFNRGMRRILGTVDGEELARQYAGGGAMAAAGGMNGGDINVIEFDDGGRWGNDEGEGAEEEERNVVNERRRQRRLERLEQRRNEERNEGNDDAAPPRADNDTPLLNDETGPGENSTGLEENRHGGRDDRPANEATPAARKSGKKERRRNLELRREMQRQRQAAAAMGFGAAENADDAREMEARMALG
ncbi:hypothetical protein ACHAXT_005293 [Thalassiosira profunda]